MNLTDILPVQDSDSKVWFEGVQEDKLLIQFDPVSKVYQFYPRAIVLGSPERSPEWVEASGKGKLHTFTVVERSVHPQFRDVAPFVLALVDLEEGVRITSWVVDVPLDKISIDMNLRVVFREILPGLKLPCFTEV